MNKNITFTANCINFTEKLFTENKIKFTEKRTKFTDKNNRNLLRFNYMPLFYWVLEARFAGRVGTLS
jgi:hypothetical protein